MHAHDEQDSCYHCTFEGMKLKNANQSHLFTCNTGCLNLSLDIPLGNPILMQIF